MELLAAGIGLAVLLSWEKDFSRPGKNTAFLYLQQGLKEGVDLFWEIFFMVAASRFLLRLEYLGPYGREIALVFYFLLPYGLSRAQKRGGAFPLSVFTGCLLIGDFFPDSSVPALLGRVLEFATVVTVFQAGMIGLRWRLLLNPFEGAIRRIPLFFLAASILAMGFSVFLR